MFLLIITDVAAILCLQSSTETLSLHNVIIVLFSKNMMVRYYRDSDLLILYLIFLFHEDVSDHFRHFFDFYVGLRKHSICRVWV